MTGQAAKDRALAAFEAAIRARLGGHLKQIILFGSRARGDNDPDSDYDILLVVDEVTAEVNDVVDDVAGEILYEHSAVLSVFPVPLGRYENDIYSPFLINVRREGVGL